MPTMRAGDVIIAPQGRAYPYGYSFLANIEMCKTRHFSTDIQLVDMLFKYTDFEHLLVHRQPQLTLLA